MRMKQPHPLKVVLCDGPMHQCRELHDDPHIAVEVDASTISITLRVAPRFLSLAGQQELSMLDLRGVVTKQACTIINVPVHEVPNVIKTFQQYAKTAIVDREEVKPEPPRTVDQVAKLLGIKFPTLEEQLFELRVQRQQYRHRQLA